MSRNETRAEPAAAESKLNLWILAACTLAASAALFAAPAKAQTGPACVPRDVFVQGLKQEFHEAPVAMALTEDGQLLEVFASQEGNSWTIAITLPSGMSCLVLSGSDWQAKLPQLTKFERRA